MTATEVTPASRTLDFTRKLPEPPEPIKPRQGHENCPSCGHSLDRFMAQRRRGGAR